MNVSKATSVRRLRKLADTLSAVEPKHFNINSWMSIEGSYRLYSLDQDHYGLNQNNIDINKVVKKNECGAAACALGWACSIPSFRRAGLLMRTDSFKRMIPTLVIDGRVGHTDFDAGEVFFGINDQTSLYLFDPDMYMSEPSAKQVARRIRAVADKIEHGYVISDVNHCHDRIRVKYVKKG